MVLSWTRFVALTIISLAASAIVGYIFFAISQTYLSSFLPPELIATFMALLFFALFITFGLLAAFHESSRLY